MWAQGVGNERATKQVADVTAQNAAGSKHPSTPVAAGISAGSVDMDGSIM
jgi:hypothetical protein